MSPCSWLAKQLWAHLSITEFLSLKTTLDAFILVKYFESYKWIWVMTRFFKSGSNWVSWLHHPRPNNTKMVGINLEFIRQNRSFALFFS